MTEVHPQTDELIITDDQFVRVLRLNRPERRNALSESLKMKLITALLDADEDSEVRVIVITGTGPAAFCAGADLKDMHQNDQAGVRFCTPMNSIAGAALVRVELLLVIYG
ncbi:MAG: hypothetical protein RIR83_1767 [Pseudomonadota bacterium]